MVIYPYDPLQFEVPISMFPCFPVAGCRAFSQRCSPAILDHFARPGNGSNDEPHRLGTSHGDSKGDRVNDRSNRWLRFAFTILDVIGYSWGCNEVRNKYERLFVGIFWWFACLSWTYIQVQQTCNDSWRPSRYFQDIHIYNTYIYIYMRIYIYILIWDIVHSLKINN